MLLELSQLFLFAPCTQHHAFLQAIHTPLFMSYAYKFFGYSISYTALYIPMAILRLYFLIPSLLHPFPHTCLTSGNHQNVLCIHDSVSVLVCLVCFLDSIVDRCVFIAILLFIVLIFFFFLNESL